MRRSPEGASLRLATAAFVGMTVISGAAPSMEGRTVLLGKQTQSPPRAERQGVFPRREVLEVPETGIPSKKK